jgi:hypothetical protein
LAGPSQILIQSLLSLTENLKQLGIVYHPAKQHVIVEGTLQQFLTSLLDVSLNTSDDPTLHDLAFLRKICELYGPKWVDISTQIDQRLKPVVRTVLQAHYLILIPVQSFDEAKLDVITTSASEHLLRSQTFLSVLLPASKIPNLDVPLLPFGIPVAGQSYNPATDLAKPSPRFGMLLVGQTNA